MKESTLRSSRFAGRDNRATLHPESGCKYRTNFEFYKRYFEIEFYYFKIIKRGEFLPKS
jgi:hypothetical protein